MVTGNPNSDRRNKLLAWGLLLLLALIWGSSFMLIKKGLTVFSAGEVGAIRIISAAAFLLPFAIKSLKDIKKHQWMLLFSVGMFGSLMPAFLFAKAQTQIPSAVAGIINALTPLFTMIVGAILFSQKITTRTSIGLMTGFCGSFVLIVSGSGGSLTGINAYGLLVVLATIFYALNLNLIKFKIPDLTARTITSVSLMVVGPIAAIYLFSSTGFLYKLQHAEDVNIALGALVILGVLGTAIALILFNRLVKITSPIFTSSVTYIIPIIAVAWGLWDNELLYAGHYIGLALIIGGVYLTNRRSRPLAGPDRRTIPTHPGDGDPTKV